MSEALLDHDPNPEDDDPSDPATPTAVEVEDEDDEPQLPDEPPSAEDLAIDVTGLGPQRARLVRFVAWLDRSRTELKTLEQGRANFLEAMGVPAVTEERLKALIEADTSNFLAWMRSGSTKVTKKQARSFERQKLDEKLASDRHTAEVARNALDQVEKEIDAKRVEIEQLEERHRAFVYDAVVEHGNALGARYVQQIQEMRQTITALFGLSEAVARHGNFRGQFADDHVDVRLPPFGVAAIPQSAPSDFVYPGRHPKAARLAVTAEESKAAAAPWRQLVESWTADPRAEPSAR